MLRVKNLTTGYDGVPVVFDVSLKLMLVDEMSLGLMPMMVDKVLETLKQINKEKGVTILLVEQKVQEALEMADRGYVLQTGRIVAHGTGKELLESDLVKKAYLGM
jgi:branched-chain amino acid transport system ATP-binding protein